MDHTELYRALDRRLDAIISPARAAHSRRVAELAASLCAREGIDAERGMVAGLAHDMCKEMTTKAQRELAAFYSEGESDHPVSTSLMADKIVHGPAAAALLARDYALADEAMLEAVAHHTVGKPGMGGLATVLYCADKLEPGRERLEDAYRSGCLKLPLEAMLLAVVEGVIGWMRFQGREIAPETLILHQSLVSGAVHR